MRAVWLSYVCVLTSTAAADAPVPAPTQGHHLGDGMCGTPQIPRATSAPGLRHAGAPSKVIFLDRCADGCTFTGATDHDAQASKVAIRGTTPNQVYTFGPFKNYAGLVGAEADAEWTSIVECARRVYSYYDTTVVDVKPTAGTYHRAVISGLSTQLIQGDGGTGGQLLGISDVGCPAPIYNMTSFTFAESHKPFARNSMEYVKNLCWTVTHEAGHSFGLEHEYEYVDGTSACNDPMSYDTGDCDPPIRFFRNKPASCGGFELAPCFCTGSAVANSHARLMSVFGEPPMAPSILPPIAEVIMPAANQQVGSTIVGNAGHERGVERVELYVNGHKWAEQAGARFTTNGGQPNPSAYPFPIPEGLPDSVVDLQIKVYDDLQNVTESAVVTAIKGAACVDASTCATGQRCDAGKCFWDPPTGELGDSCTYAEFCLSGQCSTSTFQGEGVCTQQCVVGSADTCPVGLECFDAGNKSICYLPEDGGCCSASSSTPWAPFAMGLFLIGYVMRRRRVAR